MAERLKIIKSREVFDTLCVLKTKIQETFSTQEFFNLIQVFGITFVNNFKISIFHIFIDCKHFIKFIFQPFFLFLTNKIFKKIFIYFIIHFTVRCSPARTIVVDHR